MANSDFFNGAQLQDEHYARADMSRIHLDGVNLTGARIHAVMVDVRIIDSNLSGIDIDDANLSGARLHNINLSGAVLDNVNLSGASISNANLSGMTINGVKVTDLLAAWERQQN